MSHVYRGMDREALDRAYDNSRAVPDADAILTAYQARSRDFYATVPCQRDLRYGDQARQRYDWISCGQLDAPTFVFIHGGYWQNCAKEDFAFIARGPLGCGYNVVLVEYTLAPVASMTDITREIKALLDYLATDDDSLGIADQPLCLSGHSAGGHLSALNRSHPTVSQVLAISALVDLEPISLGQLNQKLQLTPDEIAAFSPLHHIGAGAPTLVTVGAEELPELIRHSTQYATACETAGQDVGLMHLPGRNHFTMLEDLANPDGWQMHALASMAN